MSFSLSIVAAQSIYISIFFKLHPKGIRNKKRLSLYRKVYNMKFGEFVKEKRNLVKLTQPEFAAKAGVGLRLFGNWNKVKQPLRLDKVIRCFSYLAMSRAGCEMPRID